LSLFSPEINMPTYEFRCPKGHDFEKFYRSISAAPLEVACPTCGKIAERQLSAGGGLVFKGSGFYITDYGKDGKKSERAAPAGGEAGESAAAKPDAPAPVAKAESESKPAAEKPAPPPKVPAAKSTSSKSSKSSE
jgi:putative FmdB family regulatory protein